MFCFCCFINLLDLNTKEYTSCQICLLVQCLVLLLFMLSERISWAMHKISFRSECSKFGTSLVSRGRRHNYVSRINVGSKLRFRRAQMFLANARNVSNSNYLISIFIALWWLSILASERNTSFISKPTSTDVWASSSSTAYSMGSETNGDSSEEKLGLQIDRF